MDDLPETMRIVQPVRTAVFPIFVCLAFVLLAIFTLEDRIWLQIAVYVIFGGGLVLSVAHMIVTARKPDYLELSRSGWETKGRFSGRQSYRWAECSRFEVYEQASLYGMVVATRFVICRDLRENKSAGVMGLMARVLAPKVAGCLSPGIGYEMSAEDLTNLMNRYRDAALGTDGHSGEGRDPD